MKRKIMTIVLIRDGARVLLGMKKRGFGTGKWNGFGGKVQIGESVVSGAKRELEEESKITCDELSEMGLLEFEFVGDPQIGLLQVHVFTGNSYSGTPTETDEMRPQWFDVDKLPFNEMWADDRHWLPRVMGGDVIKGYFRFRGERLLDFTLKKMDSLNFGNKVLTKDFTLI